MVHGMGFWLCALPLLANTASEPLTDPQLSGHVCVTIIACTLHTPPWGAQLHMVAHTTQAGEHGPS